MRKLFLDDLPRWDDNSRYKNKINWKECIGHKVKFIYDDIKDEVEILDYNYNNKKYYLDILYNEKILSISPGHFSRCKIGNLIKDNKTPRNKYKYNIGDIIDTKTGKVKILERVKIPNGKYHQKGYKYKCLNDGNIDIILECNLNKGKGCNVCCIPSKKVLKGYNDLWTTHSEVAELLKNQERGYKKLAENPIGLTWG